jgi:hypothetical protein
VDIVFADVPYGWHSQWRELSSDLESRTPLWAVLDALSDILTLTSLVAIVSDKQQKASHESYQRVEQFQVGKRRAVILRLCT